MTVMLDRICHLLRCLGESFRWRGSPERDHAAAERLFLQAKQSILQAEEASRRASAQTREATAATIRAERVLRRTIDKVIIETMDDVGEYFGPDRER